MKKNFFVYLVLFMALSFSCNKENGIPVPEEESQFQTITCTIADPDPDTKMVYTVSGNKVKTEWEEGDEILIHGKWCGKSGTNYYSRTISLESENISADGKTATFTIETFTQGDYHRDKSTLFAAYPASAVAVDNGATTWYSYTFFNTSNAPILIGYNDTDLNDGNTFKFLPVCGVISFKVSGDFDGYTFSGKSGETVGYETGWRTNVYKKESSVNETYIYSGAVGVTEISGKPVSNGTTLNFISIPGGVNLTAGFTIKFKKNGVVTKVLGTSSAVDVYRGRMVDLGEVTAHLIDPPAEADNISSISFADATDLSATATANCYIVTSPGKYKIKLVKGNSLASVGAVSDQAVIWETYNDDTASGSINVIDGIDRHINSTTGDRYLVFETPSSLNYGNALIAAKDGDGNILWSWHIWVPKTAPTSNTYGIHASKEMMDRNLGALSAPDKDAANPQDAGFFYQWGRKDPLRTISSYADGTLATTSPAGIWTTSSTQLTTENMHMSPCVFIKDNLDWLSTRENSLWTDNKTIFDPCPAGYKVPKYGYTSFFDYFTIANYAGWSFNEEQYNFTIGATTDPVAVFPFGHFTRNAAYDLSDGKAWIWTATYKSDTEQENARAVTVSGVNSRSCSGQRKANGVYVRCVAE